MPQKIKGEQWTGSCEPIELAKSMFQCPFPDCKFTSSLRIAVLSHYRHNHFDEKEIEKIKMKKGEEKKKVLIKCCKNTSLHLLSKSDPAHLRAIKLGYTVYCLNCEELIEND